MTQLTAGRFRFGLVLRTAKAHDHSMYKAKPLSPLRPKRGGPTRLVLIEPLNEAGRERRMYQCVLDKCSGKLVVMFRDGAA
jgi:hypothetical protein